LCYWKQWKKGKTRAKQLEKLGIKPHQAHMSGNTRKGYWRTVHSPILGRALNNALLKEAGFVSLKEITNPLKTVHV
jgi:RNA-directed DNA polymerase